MADLNKYSIEYIEAAMNKVHKTMHETIEELDFDSATANLMKKTISTYEHALRVLLGRTK